MEGGGGGAVDMRELIQRELEKEMMVEKIIAEEVERFHVLEQVRRELMLGRQMMAMNISIPSSSFMPTMSRAEQKPPSLHSTELNSYSPKKKIEWRCPICTVTAPCERGFLEHLAGKKHMAKVGAVNYSPKWICPICEVYATCECGLLNHLTRKEHKARVAAADYSPKWICPICEVSTTCERGLLDHVKGKKHKAKVADANYSPWICPICEVSATCECGLRDHLTGKEHKANAESLRADNSGITSKSVETYESFEIENFLEDVSVDSAEDKKKKLMEWRCPICKVIATSEVTLQTHLAGRKHKAKLILVRWKEEAVDITPKPYNSDDNDNLTPSTSRWMDAMIVNMEKYIEMRCVLGYELHGFKKDLEQVIAQIGEIDVKL